jgi:hypothetical protein
LLSTNEVRARAAEFAREWKDAHYESGEKQSFYDDFFNVFGMKRRQVATFEEPVKRLGGKHGFIDLSDIRVLAEFIVVFASDRERVEHLFALYEKLAQPLTARADKTKRGRKGREAANLP